jgi:hypothetical protein
MNYPNWRMWLVDLKNSDLGHKAYLSYWTWALLNVLKEKLEIEVDELR